jgi:GT2 family glycosyltransferase
VSSKVSVVVLCFNGIELTIGCLDSIQKQDYPEVEIILVDNGSKDGTIPIISEKYPQALWIQNRENLGYALGNNLGIEYALSRGADAVFLVNNDTRLHESCISSLMNTLQNDTKIGIIGPMVYTWDQNKTISSAGGMVECQMAHAVNVGMGEKDTGQYTARYVDFVNGCGIMVRREALQRVGGLDPLFFMYWEETDWCMRTKKAGFEVYFNPAGKMDHKAPILSTDLGATTLYYITRNRFLFFKRHTPLSQRLPTLARSLKGTVSGIRENRKNGKMAHAKAMRWALWHAVIGHWGRVNPEHWLGKG